MLVYLKVYASVTIFLFLFNLYNTLPISLTFYSYFGFVSCFVMLKQTTWLRDPQWVSVWWKVMPLSVLFLSKLFSHSHLFWIIGTLWGLKIIICTKIFTCFHITDHCLLHKLSFVLDYTPIKPTKYNLLILLLTQTINFHLTFNFYF